MNFSEDFKDLKKLEKETLDDFINKKKEFYAAISRMKQERDTMISLKDKSDINESDKIYSEKFLEYFEPAIKSGEAKLVDAQAKIEKIKADCDESKKIFGCPVTTTPEQFLEMLIFIIDNIKNAKELIKKKEIELKKKLEQELIQKQKLENKNKKPSRFTRQTTFIPKKPNTEKTDNSRRVTHNNAKDNGPKDFLDEKKKKTRNGKYYEEKIVIKNGRAVLVRITHNNTGGGDEDQGPIHEEYYNGDFQANPNKTRQTENDFIDNSDPNVNPTSNPQGRTRRGANRKKPLIADRFRKSSTIYNNGIPGISDYVGIDNNICTSNNNKPNPQLAIVHNDENEKRITKIKRDTRNRSKYFQIKN